MMEIEGVERKRRVEAAAREDMVTQRMARERRSKKFLEFAEDVEELVAFRS